MKRCSLEIELVGIDAIDSVEIELDCGIEADCRWLPIVVFFAVRVSNWRNYSERTKDGGWSYYSRSRAEIGWNAAGWKPPDN